MKTLCTWLIIVAAGVGIANLPTPSPRTLDPTKVSAKALEPISAAKKTPFEPPWQCTDSGSQHAKKVLERFLIKDLKSPSSASFPMRARSIQRLKCSFVVTSYVDASNGFGAQIRKPYNGIIRYNPLKKSWTLLALNIGG